MSTEKCNYLAALSILLIITSLCNASTIISDDDKNHLVIQADQGKDTIAPEIYGHFAEHLGRCVYEGFWVGEDSDIPNVRGIRIVKIACGPGGIDYKWMDVVMERAHNKMDAVSLHYYVRGTGNWTVKGSATKFDEKEWFALMKNTLGVYELIEKNIEIMDKYDRRGRIGLYVDEWGTWWDSEPGTNGGFLYQQNTLRDAVSCGIFLNAFNENCKRVRMANIAQTNNVLQAMILTRGKEMILTPTYHVFEMFKVHQGATYLPYELTCSPYKHDNKEVSSLVCSASKNNKGQVHISLCNLNPRDSAFIECQVDGFAPGNATGRILTADKMNDHNTFESPDNVKPKILKNITIKNRTVMIDLPAKSVAVIRIDK